MCGIVGIASNKNCVPDILSGLKVLEYRGYDSSGIACSENNDLTYKKAVGKISSLIQQVILFHEYICHASDESRR